MYPNDWILTISVTSTADSGSDPFHWTKFTAKKQLYIFWIKNYNLPISRPPYRTSKLQKKLSKEDIQHFKTWNFFNLCLLLWVIVALLDPDSEYRVRIRIHWPNWIWIQYGSGTNTLVAEPWCLTRIRTFPSRIKKVNGSQKYDPRSRLFYIPDPHPGVKKALDLGTGSATLPVMSLSLKVPKREIFDRSDFPDFYTIKSSWVGDLLVKLLTYYFNFWGSYATFSFCRACWAYA